MINSVQYPNLISASACGVIFTTFALSPPSKVRSTSFPINASKAPSRTTIRPCPPESTTPASFSTGSISGVFARTLRPSSSTSSRNVCRSSASSASSSALSATPLATVRIVPSLGFITALYAVSTPLSTARASATASSSSRSRIPLVNPRRS